MSINLKGKVGIVTGGGHGIGRVYCVGLAVHVDVADENSTIKMTEAAIKKYKKIDFLINNAAIFATIPMSRVGFDEVPVDEWEKLMRVNVTGMWFCCRAVAPYMKKQKSGKIINISSGSIFSGTGKRIHYVTSKAAVIGFTRTLARELGDYNICVNALAPGSTLSEKPDDPKAIEFRKRALGKRCLKKIQYPDDLVGVMVFLCSDASDFMTGQTLIVDGGGMMI